MLNKAELLINLCYETPCKRKIMLENNMYSVQNRQSSKLHCLIILVSFTQIINFYGFSDSFFFMQKKKQIKKMHFYPQVLIFVPYNHARENKGECFGMVYLLGAIRRL